MPYRCRDSARRVAAISLAPAFEQPVRSVTQSVAALFGWADLRDAAQDGVDKAGVPGSPAIGLGEPHGQIDRRMVGHLQPENLSRSEQEDGFDARRVRGKSLFEESADQLPKRAETAPRRINVN